MLANLTHKWLQVRRDINLIENSFITVIIIIIIMMFNKKCISIVLQRWLKRSSTEQMNNMNIFILIYCDDSKKEANYLQLKLHFFSINYCLFFLLSLFFILPDDDIVMMVRIIWMLNLDEHPSPPQHWQPMQRHLKWWKKQKCADNLQNCYKI